MVLLILLYKQLQVLLGKLSWLNNRRRTTWLYGFVIRLQYRFFVLFLVFKSDRLWNSGGLGLFPNLVDFRIVLDTGHIILFLTSHESLLLGETGRSAFLFNVTSGVLVFFFTWFEAFLLWFWFFSQSK